MNEWCVQFRQWFNDHASQCKVYVSGATVDEAMDRPTGHAFKLEVK